MQKRKLGKSNLEVSAMGLGCMRLSPGDSEKDPHPVGLNSRPEFIKKARKKKSFPRSKNLASALFRSVRLARDSSRGRLRKTRSLTKRIIAAVSPASRLKPARQIAVWWT